MEDNGDSTLIPSANNMASDCSSQNYCPSVNKSCIINSIVSVNGSEPKITFSIDNLFPSPGVIIKDIYELYKVNESRRERDSAVLNYLNLLFRKNN